MRSIMIIGLMAGALAACASSVPESNRGVGFGDPVEFERQRLAREQALAGSGSTTFAGQPGVPETTVIPTSELEAAGIGQSAPTQQPIGAPLSAMSPQTPPADVNNPAISDENDFGAVSSRETIESDAQRLERIAAMRQEVAPTALPTRPAATGPNIVEYALSAPNRKGQEWYSRSLLSGQARFQRNCAGYNTPDDAQRDFLARGGPERDPRGIDPDGDGFACGWDPAPFLLAAGR